jgi:hypothetical protein
VSEVSARVFEICGYGIPRVLAARITSRSLISNFERLATKSFTDWVCRYTKTFGCGEDGTCEVESTEGRYQRIFLLQK